MLAIADLATALAVAGSLALFPGGTLVDALWAAVFAPAWILLAKLSGLYDRDQRSLRHLTVDELPAIFVWTLAATAATDALPHDHPGRLARDPASRSGAGSSPSPSPSRCAASRAGSGGGSSRASGRSSSAPARSPTRPGASSSSSPTSTWRSSTRWTSSTRRPASTSTGSSSRRSSLDEALLADLLEFCRDEHIKLSVVPPARGMFGTAVRLNHVADLSVVEYTTWDVSRSTLFLKRVLDLVVGSVALLLFLPVFLVVALAIRIETRGPAIFTQLRAGHGRTPVQDAEVPHDGRGRRGAPAAARPVRQPARPDVQAARTIPA